MQSHKCAYLDPCGDRCRCDEHCQYKLTTATTGFMGPVICGKDQIIAIQADREPEFDGTEITIGGPQ
jgi:hypothetical protein